MILTCKIIKTVAPDLAFAGHMPHAPATASGVPKRQRMASHSKIQACDRTAVI